MIIIDTNVISEMMKPSPATAVVTWFNKQDPVSLYLTTITIGEIGYGIWILPVGKRRRLLAKNFEALLKAGFENRILAFDEAAAHHYGDIMGKRKKIGRPLACLDGQISAIAQANIYAIATRNTKDFEHCGPTLLNPFET